MDVDATGWVPRVSESSAERHLRFFAPGHCLRRIITHRASRLVVTLVLPVLLFSLGSATPAQASTSHVVPLVMSASDRVRQGFVRVINHSGRAGTVRIHGFDDTGRRYGPVELSLDARASVQFNSRDIETGNAAKGLSGGLGEGEGDWRLRLETDLDIEPLAYIRSADGFLTAMQQVAVATPAGYHLPIFNPGSNRGQRSRLRLVNPTAGAVDVTIVGRDARGQAAPGGEVRLTVAAGTARTLTAQEIEAGGAGFEGRLGDGAGKWQLFITADGTLLVMSLLQSPTGHLSNLSVSGRSGREHLIPFFLSASDPVRHSFARIINRSEEAGEATIYGFDDTGRRYGPITLSLGAKASVQFNSGDLETGNAAKGLSGGLGDGEGDWRLRLDTDLDIEPSAYIRTGDGFLTPMHALVRESKPGHHDVAFFNPGSNLGQRSRLRLINPTQRTAEVTVRGLDARGRAAPGGEVRLSLPAGTARWLTAQELESGGDGLEGRLGDGAGKWQLSISSDASIQVMNLLLSPTGHLSNLSARLRAPRVVADRPPPPPLGDDPPNLSGLADGFRTREFANNPSLHEMNAHWAYARGVTGDGETIAMTDSGLYAAHVDFRGQLHDETVYTVISDDADGDGWHSHHHKVGDLAPETAYPPVTRETREPCFSTGRQCSKFDDYGHGTGMAALAVAARDSGTAHLAGATHGLAFNAKLRFLPALRQSFWYHFPDGRFRGWVTRHDLVRNLGNVAPVVSNAWLTHRSNFVLDGYPPDGYLPFFWALAPNYAGYQSERDVGERAVLVWSACNVPSTDGPKCGDAALPSLTERQLRAATGGATGLADVVLTAEQRNALSSAEALRQAEAIVAAWRKHWLAVTSVNDADFDLHSPRPVDCALMDSLRQRGAEECAVDYTMINTSRCGFASDWCVAAGSAYASLQVSPGGRVPDPEKGYVVVEYRTSPASAAAGAAFGLLLQAYRGANDVLTVGTHKVLERLKLTANADIFDYRAAHSPDGRSLVQIEEEQIRALIGIAGATDGELRDVITAARADFASLLPEIAPGDLDKEESGGSFTSEERRLIAAAKDGLSSAQMERFQILSRVSDYFSSHWRRIDTFAPQLRRIKKLLDETEPSDPANTARANDLLARLIRQVEWIDEQLRRIDRTKHSVTGEEVRRITVTSMIGHGLIDLKAATDPAR